MDPIGTCDRLQSRQRFEAGIARHFVTRDGLLARGLLTVGGRNWRLNRHELRHEPAFIDRARRAKLRFQPKLVGVLARDSVLGRDPLSALELARELIMLAIGAG